MVVLVVISLLVSMGVTFFGVFILNYIDTSPTKDNNSRGGHDF